MLKVGQRIETNGYNLTEVDEGVVSKIIDTAFVIDLPGHEESAINQNVYSFDLSKGPEFWIDIFEDENIFISPEGVYPKNIPVYFTVDIDMTGWSQEKRDRFFHFAESYVNQQTNGGAYIPDVVIKRAHQYAHNMVSLKGL